MVRRFLGEMRILDWGQDAADTYALLRHQLRVVGTPMDHLDLMIAAHAISLNAILVTNNTRHFGRLTPTLMIENWVTD
jgi:tRNA(fMet)-specific endonuclease VapC